MRHYLAIVATLFLLATNLTATVDASTKGNSNILLKEVFTHGSQEQLLQNWKVESGDPALYSLDAEGIVFNIPEKNKNTQISLRRSFPIEALRGYTVYASAHVQAENITQKQQPWNGAVFRATLEGRSGVMNSGGGMANVEDLSYPQANIAIGSFPWTKVGFVFSIPKDTTAAWLEMGMKNVTGKVWFRDIQVTVVKTAEEDSIVGTVRPPFFKGHSLPRLRGVEVSYAISEEDIRVLANEWNANVIRWQLGESTFADGLETRHYHDILERELQQFDRVLPLCRKYGLYVVLNLQSLSKRLFVSRENQDRLVGVWQMLAKRYKGESVILAYDIANEPLQSTWQEGAMLWNDLAQRVASEIRKIDTEKPIMIESELMSLPDGYLTLKPVDVPNVIYSVHVYSPGDLTHNRVWDENQKPVTYPGVIEKELWNKDRIRQDLAPVVAFQKAHKCHIFVGEFGAVRWSPGSDEYIKDMIDLFEEYGWDWTYHAYREWHGWSAEHGPDIKNESPSPEPTPREKLLRSWFSKNTKPSFTSGR
ncbi:hypothetical protein Ga0100231_004240 [Opitutaceae bacterium TAV4]|nr:hypothetical protein Ga0100231_004240 [Opitutaceae bacterium TAV4]RRK02240.1 hypothetical protein Ga0100230_003425 [Opitutaceae bacterium TAV3]